MLHAPAQRELLEHVDDPEEVDLLPVMRDERAAAAAACEVLLGVGLGLGLGSGLGVGLGLGVRG